MKIKHFNHLFFIYGLVSIPFLLGAQSAYAKSLQDSPQSTDTLEITELTSEVSNVEMGTDASTTTELPSGSLTAEVAAIPTPGMAETSAASLQLEEFRSQTVAPDPDTTPDTPSPIAQTVTPGRATRSGPSYIAVGGNIGFGGRTALGRGNFTITSKIGLTNYLSARPGLVVGRSPTILLPVTFDFPVRSAINDRIRVAPFVGGGLAISTRGGSAVRPLAMGGIDVPLGDRFTATASANAAFFRRPEIGVILGVGYNF